MKKVIKIQCGVCKKYRTVKSRRLSREAHEKSQPRCKQCWRDNRKLLSNDRFWKFVNKNKKPDQCWNWIGSTKRGGYGYFSPYGEKPQYAHRISFRISKGEIPNGMKVLHSCDNPKCVNPQHLRAGTQKDNMDDMYKKGRAPNRAGENNGRSKLKQKDIATIKERHLSGLGYGKISNEFGVSTTTIKFIIKGKMWNKNENILRKK